MNDKKYTNKFSSRESTESFLYAHHVMEDPYIPPKTPPLYVYFNFLSES